MPREAETLGTAFDLVFAVEPSLPNDLRMLLEQLDAAHENRR